MSDNSITLAPTIILQVRGDPLNFPEQPIRSALTQVHALIVEALIMDAGSALFSDTPYIHTLVEHFRWNYNCDTNIKHQQAIISVPGEVRECYVKLVRCGKYFHPLTVFTTHLSLYEPPAVSFFDANARRPLELPVCYHISEIIPLPSLIRKSRCANHEV